jgi:predicted acylesterase/phospholipase RssA
MDTTPFRFLLPVCALSSLSNKINSFRSFLTRILARVQYSTLGDLYIPTTLSTVDQRTGATLRLSSTDPLYTSLSLLDVLLCSTAIPIAFQPGTLPQLSKYSQFLDGATGIDAMPVLPLFDIADLQVAYIITYNYAITEGIMDNSLPFDSKDNTLLNYALQAFDILRANIAIGGKYLYLVYAVIILMIFLAIEILKSANFAGYVYEPNFTTSVVFFFFFFFFFGYCLL